VGINDGDAGVRAIGEIVFRAIRIDEADVERCQRLPVNWIAVTHLVGVLSGAPGPTQAANAAERSTSAAAPSSAVAAVPEK